MAVHKKNWTSATQIIGTGDGYITLSGTTESFSSNVDMATNGYEGAHVIVEMDYDGTPTDEVEISIYGSLDGTNYDDTPRFIIKDVAHFRLGVKQAGTTDSHNVRAYVRTWNYSTT